MFSADDMSAIVILFSRHITNRHEAQHQHEHEECLARQARTEHAHAPMQTHMSYV